MITSPPSRIDTTVVQSIDQTNRLVLRAVQSNNELVAFMKIQGLASPKILKRWMETLGDQSQVHAVGTAGSV